MQQDLSLQRDELAQAHQLGELQKEYTIAFGKQIALNGVGVFIGFIVIAIIGSAWGITWGIISGLVFTVLIGGFLGGWLYYYRRLHVYVYTGGLIYLNGNKRRAVRWEQVTSVGMLARGNFTIYVKDEPMIGFPTFIDQIGDLHATIQGEVDNPRRSGQEREQPAALASESPVTPSEPQQLISSPGKPFDPGTQVPVNLGTQRGTEGGSRSQQDLILQRDELAQAHQLGEFQREYTIPFGKHIRNLLFFAFIVSVPLLRATISHIPIILTIIFALFYIWVIGSVLVRLIYYRRLHVYLYTGGLVYLNGNNRTAVRWEQINNISRGRVGAVNIDLGEPTEPRLRLTSLIDGIGGLYYTIKREQGTMPASQFNVQPPYAAAPRRRRLWIIWGALGIGALVLIAGLVVFGVITFTNLPTPTSTLNAFCSALKSGDYQTAYNQFSSGLQSQIAEVQFAAIDDPNLGLGKVTNCTVSNVNNAAGSGTINTTFASGKTLVFDYALVNQSGTWKINGYRARSSPTLTLLIFCYALKSQNYPAAYNQLSSSQQRQQSEAQFANLFIRDTVTTCMVSNVNDTAGTGSITRTYADGSSNTFDYTLIVEHGTWKINTRHVRP